MSTGEYKPRRLGDLTGSTTPRDTPPSLVHDDSNEATFELFSTLSHMPYTGSGGNGVFVTANLYYCVPLKPLACNFKLDYARVKIGTASASQVGRGAFYIYSNGNLTKVQGSDVIIPSDTLNSIITVPVSLELNKKNQYFWVSGATSTTPQFSVFSLSDGSPRNMPYYTISISGLGLTGLLPNTLAISSLTRNYTSNIVLTIIPTFCSKDMLPFI